MHTINHASSKPIVGVRLRPPAPDPRRPGADAGPTGCWSVEGSNTIKTNLLERGVSLRQHEAAFTVDHVFQNPSMNLDVFEALALPILEAACEHGQSGCVIAYGMTGSGKSHTMQGGSARDDLGLVNLAIMHLLERDGVKVSLSSCEIYLDQVTNLLGDGTPPMTSPRTSSTPEARRAQRQLLTPTRDKRPITSYQQAASLLLSAQQGRTQASTKLNHSSSRSHMIVQLDIEQQMQGGRTATVMLVDLAGSEDPKKSGASGKQMSEAISINLSLYTLSNVITAWAANPFGHIPVEDSTLTRKLKPCLSPGGKVAILVTIRSEPQFQSESKRTLKFAEMAMRLVTLKPMHATKGQGEHGHDDKIAELTAKLQYLETLCMELRRENVTAKAREVASADEARRAKSQLQSCLRELQAYREELLATTGVVTALQLELASLQPDVSDAGDVQLLGDQDRATWSSSDGCVASLRDMLKSSHGSSGSNSADVVSREGREPSMGLRSAMELVNTLKEQLKEKELLLEDLRGAVAEQIQSPAKSDISAATTAATSQTAAIEAAVAEVSRDYSNQVSMLQAEVQILEASLMAQESTITQLRTQLRGAEVIIAGQDRDQETRLDEFVQLEADRARLASRLSEAENKLLTVAATWAEEKRVLMQDHDKVRKEPEDAQDQLAALRGELQALQREQDGMRSELGTLQKEREEVQDGRTALVEQSERLVAECAVLKAEKIALEEERDGLLTTMRQERDALGAANEQALQQVRDEHDAYVARLRESHEGEVEELRAALKEERRRVAEMVAAGGLMAGAGVAGMGSEEEMTPATPALNNEDGASTYEEDPPLGSLHSKPDLHALPRLSSTSIAELEYLRSQLAVLKERSQEEQAWREELEQQWNAVVLLNVQACVMFRRVQRVSARLMAASPPSVRNSLNGLSGLRGVISPTTSSQPRPPSATSPASMLTLKIQSDQHVVSPTPSLSQPTRQLSVRTPPSPQQLSAPRIVTNASIRTHPLFTTEQDTNVVPDQNRFALSTAAISPGGTCDDGTDDVTSRAMKTRDSHKVSL